jgi:hypothetical protein
MMEKDEVSTMQVSYRLPENIGQTLAEIASWTFFLVMLGELAYGEIEKRKILDFWSSTNVFST